MWQGMPHRHDKSYMLKKMWDRHDSCDSKGSWYQGWGVEFPLEPSGGRREPIPESYSLTLQVCLASSLIQACTYLNTGAHTCMRTHIDTHTSKTILIKSEVTLPQYTLSRKHLKTNLKALDCWKHWELFALFQMFKVPKWCTWSSRAFQVNPIGRSSFAMETDHKKCIAHS